MFEDELPEISALAGVDDAALVDAITGCARLEAAAAASRLAAIAELTNRRCRSELAAKRDRLITTRFGTRSAPLIEALAALDPDAPIRDVGALFRAAAD